MKIFAKDYGVIPGNTDACALQQMFKELAGIDGAKELEFEKGDYIVDASKLEEHMLFITNTVGDREFSRNETPHKNRAMIYADGVCDLVINGNDARFVANGKCTNMVLRNCKNVTVNKLGFSAISPDMHEVKVVGVSRFSVDFEADKNTKLTFKGGRPYFCGVDYCVAADKNACRSYHIGLVKKNTPHKIERVHHPLSSALRYKKLGGNRFRAYFIATRRFDIEDCFYIYDVRRQYAGIFLDSSENIVFDGVFQNFNYSLAIVAQNCDMLDFSHLNFVPDPSEELKMASAADFIQICMCRGKVKITDSNFCGAGDDCLNVHGFHFKIKERNGNRIVVSFGHPQSHGFNALRSGDTVAFVNSGDLLEYGRAKIVSSELIDEYNISLTLDSDSIPSNCNVIEDISACPQLLFSGNTVDRIITRGILCTTREKSVISNNTFVSTTMSGVLLSDDAKNWFESGPCLDIEISGNTFCYCGDTPILIKPENSVHNGCIHKNITVSLNKFLHYSGHCISAKSAENIVVSANEFSQSDPVKTKNCRDIKVQQ